MCQAHPTGFISSIYSSTLNPESFWEHTITIKPRTAHALIWSLALVPVAFFAAGLGATDFDSASAILNMLGRLAGVAGLALLLLSAALSARVPGVDLPFGGLTKLWQTHHLLGAGSLLLLLAHPLLLAFAASAWGQGLAFSTLFPPLADLATWAGWLALLLMMVFLAPSFAFFGAPNYERWKRVHALAGPAVILALIHTFLFSRTMPGPTDTIVWSLFALLGVGAVSWLQTRLATFTSSRPSCSIRAPIRVVLPVPGRPVIMTKPSSRMKA